MIAVLAVLFIVAAVAGAAVMFARRRWMLVTVCGVSMLPTLQDGELVVARRWRPTTTPRIGDIIVFPLPASEIPDALGYRIKRISAIGPTAEVLAGHVMVEGDNPRSQGSRHFGSIAVSAIIASAGPRARP